MVCCLTIRVISEASTRSSGAVTFICVYEIKIKRASRVDLENIQIVSSKATKLLVESLINTHKTLHAC